MSGDVSLKCRDVAETESKDQNVHTNSVMHGISCGYGFGFWSVFVAGEY